VTKTYISGANPATSEYQLQRQYSTSRLKRFLMYEEESIFVFKME
jgi:hypothetical protein